MAAMMKNMAAASVNKGYPSSFYTGGKPNPVLQALEQEIKLYLGYMKKRAAAGHTKLSEDESCSRYADTLFELWNKYEPKLPKTLYQRKLLEMGDHLVSIKEYNLALWQCYGRYLKSSGDVNVEEITDVDTFKKVFFPDGFDTEDAGFTFRALMGKTICAYQVVRQLDPKLQNPESVEKCIALLMFLRLVTQVILPKEHLCWLVYNGTIHIYSISRHLMKLGHSAKVLEFALWACMCMESSVPLLAVKYLAWRSTLYTMVCQCYYDCKAGHHAEAFARRALTKINELSQLESMSNATENKDTEVAFRHATIKMAAMVYKRTVFETRRKPKGLLRPKTRANLKDAAQLPWPRTQSEKLLVEMFEGSSSQALCVLETLTDSNRRTLLSAPPATENEVEILDVTAELFMAAQEIIAGGGGSSGAPAAQKSGSDAKLGCMGGLIKETDLMELAATGEDGIPLSAVVKIVKLAYSYEQWDVLDSLLVPTILAIKETSDNRYGPDEKALELLQAYDRVVPRAKHRKLFHTMDEDDDGGMHDAGLQQPASQGTIRGTLNEDNLIQLAEVLLSIVNGPYMPYETDVDMVVDACLLLWNKCKSIFQRYQTGSSDNPKYLQRMENPSKWVYILDIVHQVLGWCGLSSVDPALTAEVVLRLALVYEASAALETKENKKYPRSRATTESPTKSRDYEDDQSVLSSLKDPQGGQTSNLSGEDGNRDPSRMAASQTSIFSQAVLNQSMRDQLLQAREIVEVGLQNVAYARQAVALTDSKAIADVGWAKELNPELFDPVPNQEDLHVTVVLPESEELAEREKELIKSGSSEVTSVWNTVKDLHLELIFLYHRICLKLASLGPQPEVSTSEPKPFVRKTCSRIQHSSSTRLHQSYIENFDELVALCHKNSLSRSLLLMQKAISDGSGGKPTGEKKKLLEEAMELIKKVQTEEKRLYADNTLVVKNSEDQEAPVKPSKVPPPPLLLCRTDTMAVLKPASYVPASGEKVSWYRVFARTSSGSNVKVRLNDYYLPGTGEEVPAFRCELRVTGLTPGEKYIYAVAAYTAEGKLIGGSVGDSTKPVLASHPLPVLMNWAYLSQVAYQVGYFSIAKEACEVLWSHFVAQPPPPDQITFLTNDRHDFKLTLHRLNERIVSLSSPVLLRMFLTSIFIHVDIHVKEGQLFCDTLCDRGPPHKGQINRLHQCEKMLVALELAGWLNEANLALQAVVQCYGLLSPMIHFKIPSIPIIQILERCNAVLQEVPVNLRQKRSTTITDGLHHMTACLTYYMAKVLRVWGQRALASNINEAGRKLLAQDAEKDKDKAPVDQEPIEVTDTGSLTLAALKKKKMKPLKTHVGKEEVELTGNEELRALEAHILSLSKQAQGEHELTGNEDPSILHAYIAYLPSRLAQKEVIKFKRRARYLEFFVQVAQKALSEGIPDLCVDWSEDTGSWLNKRNEGIIGSKATVGKQAGATTIIGDDPKKFAAALVEYTKDKSGNYQQKKEGSPRTREKEIKAKPATKARGKKQKYKAIGITPNMSDAQKQQQEELELKALEILKMYFVDLFHVSQKRKKLRKISTEEMPWRAQFNIVHGLGQFGVFLSKLENREKMTGTNFSYLYRTSNLEEEWFSFETAGTLVVGWSGGPSRQHTRQQGDMFGMVGHKEGRSGIELAAAAATGKAPPPLYPIPREEEDTPRTYRSEADTFRHPPPKQTRAKKGKDDDPESMLLQPREAIHILKKTFKHLKRAVVLAHRGHHWTLLQNSCRALWNCAHTALMKTHSPTKTSDCFLDVKSLRGISWDAFCLAADCLLDMLLQIQHDTEKRSKGKKDRETEVITQDKQVKSMMGGITDDKGGAGLKFESPLDDISNVDTRWVKRIVLRTLELLYYEQKWERLVDLALRFNALSDDRYGELVNPLMIQAQRKLVQRVADYGGHTSPQPHFLVAMENGKQPITAKQYTSMQIEVQINADDLSRIEPGGQIDPEGQDVYQGGLHALRLCSVPIDVDYSLKNLREVLDKSNYSARALQHSRRLLILYLSGQTNTDSALLNLSPTHVDFVPNTAKPQPTMPPDISKELYLSMDDIQTSPLPKSQMNIVVSSYDRTIEMLLAGGNKGLAAEAMRELGNLHYHSSNLRAAYKWWAESLDLLLNMSDAIHQWRRLLEGTDDISRALLDRCGLWGCVLGGILASNIAQYVLNSDLGKRTECCFLAGYFFKALFKSSLPHPTSDKDYALYEVGEGCEVTNLIPGIDLLSERFRSDGRTVVAALKYILYELSRGHHNLFVLPLLTLYLYFTTFICRDLQRSVEGRILKLRVLTDLSFFSEAFVTLQRLLCGDRLPHALDNSFRQVEGKMTTTKVNTAKPLLEPSNLKILELGVDKRLSTQLSVLYGPHLTCQLSIAQAHLLVTVADTIPALPKFEDIAPPGTSSLIAPPPAPVRRDHKFRPKPPPSKIPNPDDAEKRSQPPSEEEASGMNHPNKRFTDATKPVSLDIVKGTLLATADQMIATLSEIVAENAQYSEKGLSGMSAAELELVILCKLEMAAIARQRHHSAMAARIVISALKLIKESEVFKEKRENMDMKRVSSLRRAKDRQLATARDPSPHKYPELDTGKQFDFQNAHSRARLDSRLWLTCYHSLVKSMTGEIRGVGQVKVPEQTVKAELADVRQYCGEGIMSADACGDLEMQAEFLFQAVLINTMDGVPVSETKALLQDILQLLSDVPQLSPSAQLLQTTVLAHLADLELIEPDPGSDPLSLLRGTIRKYVSVHDMVLQQLEYLGEDMEHRFDGKREYSTPASPLKNLYLPHLLLLTQLKLRMGYTQARIVAKNVKQVSNSGAIELWTEPLGVLTTALNLSKVIAQRLPSLEAEILVNIGKIQRQLFHLGKISSRVVAETLVEAIKTSFSSDHDLSLMRQSYLELAILYLASSGSLILRENSILEPVPDSEDDISVASKESSKRKKKTQKRKLKKSLPEDEKDKERRAAWVAVRCATAVAHAQRARGQLLGSSKVTSQALGEKAKPDIPDFFGLDLIGKHVIGEMKRVYKNEIEEELAPLTEALEPPPIETYDDQLNRARTTSADLTWIHVIGYQSVLQRLCSTATMTAKKDASNLKKDQQNQKSDENDLHTQLDLGFFSHSEFDISLNQDIVRSVLFNSEWNIRLVYLHNFMVKHLPVFAKECSSVYPPTALQLPVPAEAHKTDELIISQSYLGNLCVPLDLQPDATEISITTSIVSEKTFQRPDQSIVTPSDSELCVQWYQPTMDEHVLTVQPDEVEERPLMKERQALLLYALWHKKTEKQSCAVMWVSLSQLMDLHDRLSVLTQRGEISLADKPSGSKKESTPTPAKGKKQARIKALSPKVKKDELLEALLRQCMSDAQLLVGYNPEPEEPLESSANAAAAAPAAPAVTGDENEGGKEQPAVIEAKSPTKEKTMPILPADDTPPEIPFEVSRVNMYNFERLYDPSLGCPLSDIKMLKWFMQFFP